MQRFGKLKSLYIIRNILPYFAFSWLLLSVILFVQQSGRYADIFFNNNLPTNLIWQLTVALIPSVVSFTCPMAILIGVVIGISKMQSDSELIALRASGVSNFQITFPIFIFGLFFSFFALGVNLRGVPFAAQIVRKVVAQGAIYKLKSPIEPGVFNTEIQGFTVYVKDGDLENGTWKNIFIYNEDQKNHEVRLITSENGRIDSMDDKSELILDKASINTFSSNKPYELLFTQKAETLRFGIPNRRGDLMDRISRSDESPEEMGLDQLAAYAKTKGGLEKIEAEILWQRRLILSMTPLIFALLGASLILRFNRGGKGFGVLLALACLIVYYMVALLGEQLARTGKISVTAASFIPLILSLAAIVWFFHSQKLSLTEKISSIFQSLKFSKKVPDKIKSNRRKLHADWSGGILDYDLSSNIIRFFLLTICFLSTVYVVFTAFEMWKFAGNQTNGVNLLLKYLFYLIPFVYVQIAPSALMVAALATYIIKSRQNEIVIWTSSGQSIYRLLLPCLVLMIGFGLLNYEIQERILPAANRTQDALRAQIRSNGILTSFRGKYWVANENRIYSFEISENTPNQKNSQKVSNLTIYTFSDVQAKLASMIKTDTAFWEKGKIRLSGTVEKTQWINETPQTSLLEAGDSNEIIEEYNPFKQTVIKPNHLNSEEVSEQMRTAESETERRNLEVALEKKRSTFFLPLVIILFSVPFAISINRRGGSVVTSAYAIALWLAFMGISTIFEQFGTGGFVDGKIAVWSPLILFALIGCFLMTKIKT